jgi:general secretion pathway protein M
VQCRELWESRNPRERVVFSIFAAGAAAVLCLWLMQSADQARTRLRSSVIAMRAQAARVEQQMIELDQLRAAPAIATSQTDLRVLVQGQINASGLSRALVNIDAVDANQVKIKLGATSFATWLNWVASLEAQYVRVETCRIEALSTPGLVSVSATLVRAKPQ